MTNPWMPVVLFAASFAAAAAAQDAQLPAKKVVHFSLAADADAGFGIALVALDDRRLPVCSEWLLAPDLAIPMFADDGHLVAKLPLPADWNLMLYWQTVGIDPHGNLQAGEVCQYDADGVAFQTLADLEPADLAPLPPVQDDAMKPAVQDDAKKPAVPVQPQLPLTLATEHADDGFLISLYAAFVAPSDGYGLALLDVVDSNGDGVVEVYLYRKLPGKGEGWKRIQQKHALTAKIPAGSKGIEVFLAEGTTSRPQGGVGFVQISPALH